MKIKKSQKRKRKYNKVIKDRLERTCAVCAKKIKIIRYIDKSYRGGYYFFDVPICTKKERNKSLKAGTRIVKIGKHEFNVLKKDPKPYKFVEYWECPKCYRNGPIIAKIKNKEFY